MQIDVLTLFPDMFNPILRESIIGRAIDKGIVDLRVIDIRDYSLDKHKKTDDYPYGGGGGMIMTAQPLYDAWRSLADPAGEPDKTCAGSPVKACNGARTIYMSPQGVRLTQKKALGLSREGHLILVCGHYEGVDERALELIADEEISIGDYVLTGGELPAMALIDCVTRLLPGVLSGMEAYMNESHYDGLLEYPQYTRPAVFKGMAVPAALLEGDHDAIGKWRRSASIERTGAKRPDLLEARPRRLAVGDAHNLRDLGGYPAKNGAVTRWRVFLRSDLLKDVSEQDISDLLAIGLTTAIDLRSAAEVKRLPSAYVQDRIPVDYHNIPLLSEAAIDRSMTVSPFKELYILFAERGKKKLVRVFTIMAASRGACLFHCYAGKDRTGIVAALLLMLAGVSREDITADYEVSGTYYRRKVVQTDAGAIAGAIAGVNVGEAAGAPLPAHILSERETIDYFIDYIENKYGAAEEYLLGAGVAGADIAALKAKFLAPRAAD